MGVGENLKEAGNHEAERSNTRWRGDIDELSGECWDIGCFAVSLGLAGVGVAEGWVERLDREPCVRCRPRGYRKGPARLERNHMLAL